MGEAKTALDLAARLIHQGGRDMGKTHAREVLAATPANAPEIIKALVEACRDDLAVLNTLDIISKAGVALRVNWEEIGKSARERICAIQTALALVKG